MPKLTEKIPQGLKLYKELETANNAESGRNSLPQGNAHSFIIYGHP